MSECVALSNVRLDRDSQKALKEIYQVTDLSNKLRNALFGGTLLSIFATDSLVEQTFNLSQADFATLNEALGSVGKIARARIRGIAIMQAQWHYGDEKAFWTGIAKGCSID